MYRFKLIVVMLLIVAGILPAAVAAWADDDPYHARVRQQLILGDYVDRLADAIYWAEGGPDTNHPYGILQKYKTTTPRQACINTIRHAINDWDCEGSIYDFIAFLGSRYCPVGAANDPTGLNKNWIKNVRELYARRKGI